MPKIERSFDPSEGVLQSKEFNIPRGVTNARLIVEWDDPPVNDWTPEDVARCIMNDWFHDGNNTRSPISMAVVVANKIAELERAECAEILTKAIEAYTQVCNFEAAGVIKRLKQKILARTNEKAGYPRMEE